jgi:carbon monoxide dehydrogenase subunit G
VKISGADTLPFPVAEVWEAMLDPRVLVATIPGCERLEATGENRYAMTVTAGVAAIKGTYAGACTLSDLERHRSLVMKLQGAGAPGTIDATVDVHFDEAEGGTRVSYDADAVVGGMVGGVGQRMLTSVSRRMAKEFFGNVGAALAGGPEVAEARAVVAAAPGAAPLGSEARPGVFTAPAAPAGVKVEDDFVKGVVLGAGLVLVGVVVGGIFGRRR